MLGDESRVEQKVCDKACRGNVSLAKQENLGYQSSSCWGARRVGSVRRVGGACDGLRGLLLCAWLKLIVYLLQTQCGTDSRTPVTGRMTVGVLVTYKHVRLPPVDSFTKEKDSKGGSRTRL